VTPGRPLCRLEDIPDGEAKGFVLGRGAARREVFVVRRGAAVLGYENACPHVGTPLDLDPDQFLSEDGRYLVCATHGALFRIEDGFCIDGPCQGLHLTAAPVVVEDGVVTLHGARAEPGDDAGPACFDPELQE
jgi:nitrite reductase/ring-hydroxylating ferredoxin subunit